MPQSDSSFEQKQDESLEDLPLDFTLVHDLDWKWDFHDLSTNPPLDFTLVHDHPSSNGDDWKWDFHDLSQNPPPDSLMNKRLKIIGRSIGWFLVRVGLEIVQTFG